MAGLSGVMAYMTVVPADHVMCWGSQMALTVLYKVQCGTNEGSVCWVDFGASCLHQIAVYSRQRDIVYIAG